jgi:hypothetical protein
MVKPPRVGDRVMVPFWPVDAEGLVTRVEGKGERIYVTVQLFLGGDDDDDLIDPYSPREPFLMTFRLRDIIGHAAAA